ncbi:hypothetical protein R1sor_005181 [Riccia sorocarpa]|uniref:Peroxisome biogenesis protein 12 n=1 Tax=Riccia sorocarpa TaxID=122646 RepID=A0ABD3HIU1_9MARC
MLMQVGGEGMRPTFFEMAAAQHLPASLRAALLYSLGVMAQRRPILHKVLDYSDEAFSALMLLLEAHSLRISDASFAEALYGLRRRSAVPTSESSAVSNNRSNREPGRLGAISRRQRNLSVLFLVGLPYLRSKMEAVYNAQRGGALQAAFWGTGDADSVEVESVGDASRNRDQRLGSDATMLQSIKSRFLKLCVQIYPWVHASHEGLSFAYQLLYLLDATEFYSPALHFLGIQVTRASGQELMDASKQIAERRKREFGRLRGSPILKTIQRGLLRTAYGFLDYAQSGLIAAVFIFKMVEWWYQSAEQRLISPTVYPPPPPPPPPKVAKDGIPLPEDRTSCPLCLEKRTNPAMVAVSGYVFCYPCIYNYVNQYRRCPITLISASEDKIRRLYYDA